MLINENNTVFYTSCNDSYVDYAIVALCSVRNHVNNPKLYVIGRAFSEITKNKLDSFGIGYHEIDLSSYFVMEFSYPIECFYIFYGPEFFAARGFDYSVYIDCDILCIGNPLIDASKVNGISGVSLGSVTEILGGDASKIKEMFPEAELDKRRIQTGVVYFNNKSVNSVNFFESIGLLFKQCVENGIPRKGDDSLMALYLALNFDKLDFRILDNRYNAIPYRSARNAENAVFFHFEGSIKPWKCINIDYFKYFLKWRKLYKSLFTDFKLESGKITSIRVKSAFGRIKQLFTK